MKYEYLDHTSEAMFKVTGDSLEEVFAGCALAMTNLMADVNEIKSVESFEVELKSKDLKSLLYDFLDHIILLKDAELVFVSEIKDLEIKDGKLTCVLGCDKAINYETKTDVKAPTYHDMIIEENESGWIAQVVVDV